MKESTNLKHCGKWAAVGAILAAAAVVTPQKSEAQNKPQANAKQPNILVIMGDDVGVWNLGVWNRGMMGYKTPNIDRIANEGILFTDYYGQQSCTAGRSAFITGQCPIRTGLSKVGMPGAKLGISDQDPTLAELLKPLGYMCAQFGKNHLGDRDEYLPTKHGFDEFFGNLYHLNAEEEPEQADYPKDPAFRKAYGPRGVIRSTADGKVEDTGPLTKKRMETADEEFLAAAKDFITRQAKAGKPSFTWFNSTRMHVFTHLKPGVEGKTGLGIYSDGMVEHDGHVGELLKLLEDLKIAENTIVIYTTDNGAMKSMWPDGGASPFRSEKNTNWEGGFRVPCAVKWPAQIKAGTVINDIVSAEDWLPTLVAAAGGDPNLRENIRKGVTAGKKTFKVYIDGYNQLPLFTGQTDKGPRNEFFYFSDDGDLLAVRNGNFKYTYQFQRAKGTAVWSEPFVKMRAPKIMDLRSDPFEEAYDNSIYYSDWTLRHAYMIIPTQAKVAAYINTYKDFPPRQTPTTWNVEKMLKDMQEMGHNAIKN